MHKLTKAIERKMIPVQNPYLANNCGLTQASRLTLSSELQNQMYQLRQVVSEESPSAELICSNLKNFRYFDLYISTEEVKKVLDEVKAIMKKFIREQLEHVNIEILRGTNSEHDFGAANVILLQKTMSRLQVITQDFPSSEINHEQLVVRIEEEVGKFQRNLMLKH